MGNRAVLVWKDKDGNYDDNSIGVYLHWNGGRDSVEAFLAYCEMCGYESPTEDPIGYERFVEVVRGFFGSSRTTVETAPISQLDTDNYDNGMYVCRGWDIVDRKYLRGKEQLCYGFRDMLYAINNGQTDPLAEEDLDFRIESWIERHGAPSVPDERSSELLFLNC